MKIFKRSLLSDLCWGSVHQLYACQFQGPSLQDWGASGPLGSSAVCRRCTEPGENQGAVELSHAMAVILEAPLQAILRTNRWCSSSPRMGTFGDLGESP